MIHRINVFLLCSILALCPAYVLASAAEKWEILENVYDTPKNTVNITAKKITQDAANSGVYKVKIPVTSSVLGATAKSMLWTGVAVASIQALIGAVGWIIDDGSKVIKKLDPQAPPNPPYIWKVGSYVGSYASTAAQSAQLFAQIYCDNFGRGKCTGTVHEIVSLDQVKVKVETDAGIVISTGFVGTRFVNPDYDPNLEPTYVPVSDAELGNEILGKGTEPNSRTTPAPDIITKAYDPNNPASDAPAPKVSNDALNNANPQPEKEPDGNSETEKEKDPETGEETGKETTKFTFPNACEWFPAACDFFKVQKQDNKEIKENQKEDIAQNKSFFDKASDWFDWSKDTPELKDEPLVVDEQPVIDYQHINHVQFGSTCPFSPQMQSLPMGVLGSMDFQTDLTFICDFGADAKPYVVSLGHLGALIFLLIGIRNGNG